MRFHHIGIFLLPSIPELADPWWGYTPIRQVVQGEVLARLLDNDHRAGAVESFPGGDVVGG
jgi:hypothetical protein